MVHPEGFLRRPTANYCWQLPESVMRSNTFSCSLYVCTRPSGLASVIVAQSEPAAVICSCFTATGGEWEPYGARASVPLLVSKGFTTPFYVLRRGALQR